MVYVAATRARDLLVVPAVGDDPFASGWEAARESWIAPVQEAVYPRAERRRVSAPAPASPPFGEDTVLDAPNRDAPGRDTVRPGLHALGAGDAQYPVVWWDPRALTLDVERTFGLRRQDLIEDVGAGVLEADRRSYQDWQLRRQAARDEGARPTFAVRTVTEWAQRAPADRAPAGGAPAGDGSAGASIGDDVDEVTVVDAGGRIPRPSGPRFGTLVHAVLATVALDADARALSDMAEVQGRLLGAPADEVAAASALVEAVLAHPLVARARTAWTAGRCRREAPISTVLPDGAILEGVLDLAFEDEDGWTVVDWKTQAELGALPASYRRQVAAYASVVARVTGRPAAAVLMRL